MKKQKNIFEKYFQQNQKLLNKINSKNIANIIEEELDNYITEQDTTQTTGEGGDSDMLSSEERFAAAKKLKSSMVSCSKRNRLIPLSRRDDGYRWAFNYNVTEQALKLGFLSKHSRNLLRYIDCLEKKTNPILNPLSADQAKELMDDVGLLYPIEPNSDWAATFGSAKQLVKQATALDKQSIRDRASDRDMQRALKRIKRRKSISEGDRALLYKCLFYVEKMRSLLEPSARGASDEYLRKAAARNFNSLIKQIYADGTFESDTFSPDTLKSQNPALLKAINIAKGKNLRKSNLLFDGHKLHWRVGNEIIFSFNASSGHYEDDVLGDDELPHGRRAIKALMAIESKYRDGWQGYSSEELKVRAVMIAMGADPDNPAKAPLSDGGEELYEPERIRQDVQEVIDTWGKMKKLLEQYKSIKDNQRLYDDGGLTFDDLRKVRTIKRKYRILSNRIRNLVQTYVEIHDNPQYETSPEDRLATAGEGGMGPIPEGRYNISHRLQDISNLSGLSFVDMLGTHAWRMGPAGIKNSAAAKEATEFLNKYKPDFESIGDQAWGRYRVRITNVTTAKSVLQKHPEAYKRSGFFIHGGSYRGSSGCIDLGDEMDSFAMLWTLVGMEKVMGKNVKVPENRFDAGGWISAKWSIPLTVKYTEKERKKLLAKNPIAKKDPSSIFDSLPAGATKDYLKTVMAGGD